MQLDLTFSAALPEGATDVLLPAGLTTPHGSVTGITANGPLRPITEASTGQIAQRVAPDGPLTVTYHFDSTVTGPYPAQLFTPHPSRFTRFADDLVAEIAPVTTGLTGIARARAIACHTAERFTYGHPQSKFNDGLDAVPALGCGLTEGSCVDINTYFIAALRASGIAAGYVTGFFFPEEKQGVCEDGHCWVVTQIDGQSHEWDIAHHLKLGTRDIQPGLNPKPGQRVACFHSMGLDFPDLGLTSVKALIEPQVLLGSDLRYFEARSIRLAAPTA